MPLAEPERTMTPEAIASLHLESYGCHPDDCRLCKEGDPTYAVVAAGCMSGVTLRHQAHLSLAVEEDKLN